MVITMAEYYLENKNLCKKSEPIEIGFKNTEDFYYHVVLGKGRSEEDKNDYYLQIYKVPNFDYVRLSYMIVNAKLNSADVLKEVVKEYIR